MLSYDYSARKAILGDPVAGHLDPHLYVLCSRCAERLVPPRGWTLEDRRSEPPLFIETGERVTVGASAPEVEDEPEQARRQLFFGYSS
ncbi:MAG: hypothetical protein QOG54_2118 [Actinomycetota bacterium]|nr:hypothetical protein [Actinomycetota bacterium]